MQGPALLIQELAWARMLIDYSRERGVATGIRETFNGEHPCELCKKAAALRNPSHKPDQAPPVAPILQSKLSWGEMVFPASDSLTTPRGKPIPDSDPFSRDHLKGTDPMAPPSPPPRSA